MTASGRVVDANGSYSVGQARRTGVLLEDLGVVSFEEPVNSDVDDLPLTGARRGRSR